MPVVTIIDRVGPVVRLSEAAAAAVATSPEQILLAWFAQMTPTRRRLVQRVLTHFAKWSTDDQAAGPATALQVLVAAGVGGAHQLVRRWRDGLLQKNLASGTVAGHCAVVGSLTRAAREAGLLAYNLERVAPRPEPRCDRSGPRRGDVERLLAYLQQLADDGDARACRDVALVSLLHNEGLRRQEALQITLADVQLDGDQTTVTTRRKGHREPRPVTIEAESVARLRRWLDVRGRAPGAVFVRVRQQQDLDPMTGESCRRMMQTRAHEAGIKSPFRPHGMRHSGATAIVKSGGTIAELMAYGGWKSMSAASRYVDALQETRASAIRRIAL